MPPRERQAGKGRDVIEEIEIEGYRSVRSVRMRMKPVLVVVGENGTGKTNLYRALQLFQAAASGNLARGIAEDGGMGSVLWAGARKRGPVRMRHPDLLDPLAELIAGMPRGNNVWLTTHAKELAESVARRTGTESIRLTKEKGETRIVGQGLIDVEDED